ncbi:MAG: hypothetical protein E7000_04310 [Coriobacteriaceae bacterium]|nr:hypothetical protein [Coriobacteriaceae bacterium]
MYERLTKRLEAVEAGGAMYYRPDHPNHPNRYTDEQGHLHLLAPGQLTPYGERMGAKVVDFDLGIPRRMTDEECKARAAPHHTIDDADAIHARLRKERESIDRRTA